VVKVGRNREGPAGKHNSRNNCMSKRGRAAHKGTNSSNKDIDLKHREETMKGRRKEELGKGGGTQKKVKQEGNDSSPYSISLGSQQRENPVVREEVEVKGVKICVQGRVTKGKLNSDGMPPDRRHGPDRGEGAWS